MQKEGTANEYRTTLVCVDNYENATLQGRLFNSATQGAKSYDNLMQFLLQMNQVLDETQFPQPFAQTREFLPAKNPDIQNQEPDEDHQRGKLATFALKVNFRQNASWQGTLQWLEGKREESFRSVLELAFLLNSALTAEQEV